MSLLEGFTTDTLSLKNKVIMAPMTRNRATKEKDIHLSWRSIRDLLSSQQRITVSMQTQAGDQIYMRTSTRAETHQQRLYEALGFSSDPIGKKKTVINKANCKNVVPTIAD